jgi:SAM-dependent methyltransferase
MSETVNGIFTADRILDLGCGQNKLPGSIGVDMHPNLPGIDVRYRYQPGTHIPFVDSSFTHINLQDFVEHVADIAALLEEIHRVAADKALVTVRFPHYSSPGAHNDITHQKFLGCRAFDHFDPSTKYGSTYGYFGQSVPPIPFRIASGSLDCFGVRPGFLARVLFRLAKKSKMMEHYLGVLLPLRNVSLSLIVDKR